MSGARDLGFAAGLLLRRPFNVLVQVTNRCNLRCSFCDFWDNGVPRSQELDVEDYEQLSDALARVGTFLVSIEGGEPLLREDLPAIVAAFAKHHLPLLYTNGWHVDAETARALFAAGLHQVGVSIDFADTSAHDAKRGAVGAAERAWRAVDLLRDAAPHGGRQVHVMTVLLAANQHELPALVARSAAAGVRHAFTVVSGAGARRRSDQDAPPQAPISPALLSLWREHPTVMAARPYLAGVDPWLTSGELPRCRAGLQSFNLDHLGNVSPCIEKIDEPVGNLRTDPLPVLLERLREVDAGAGCQDCWTLCRGMSQSLGDRGSRQAWVDLVRRMSV